MPQLLAALQSDLGANYTLQRELGGGGMSRVFLAEETRLKRQVVLKVLAPELARGVSAERFEREIALAATLQEPHIVPLHATGTTSEGIPWYTMPYVRGETLRARLAAGAVPLREGLDLLKNVAQALAYAHRQGVVHRDIKPENILLQEGTAVVTDFGIARALTDARVGNASGTLTMLGTALGTPAYMAPEQGAGDPATDHRADLYAWGVVAYEVLAGVHPFAGKTSPHAWLVAHLTETPVSLAERVPNAPATVVAVVMRCLEKDPDARPDGAEALIEAIASGATSGSVTPLAPSRADNTIAVLPFESLSPDPNDAFLADGLCEEIMTDLARVKQARVIARNSSVLYKETSKDAQTIGRELGARYLLTGTVRRAGRALRVTTQLVEADAGRQAWAEKFSGTMDDVFDFQERIAREVVGALSITLTPEEDARLQHRSIESLEAYECYLRARQLNWQFSDDALAEALALLDRAQAIEGHSAPLFAVRAHTLWNLANIGARGSDALAEASRYVDEALAIDPDQSLALVTRALLLSFSDAPDPAEAIRLMLRAAQLERTFDTHAWLAIYLWMVGRGALALSYARVARQIDPHGFIGLVTLATSEMCIGASLEPLVPEVLRKVEETRDVPTNGFMAAWVLATNGRQSLAREVLTHIGEESGIIGLLTAAFRAALCGDRDGVIAAANAPVLAGAIAHDDQFAWMVAQALTQVEEHDRAMEILWRIAGRCFTSAELVAEHDAMLAPLRGHSDFPRLIEHMRQRGDEIAAAAGL